MLLSMEINAIWKPIWVPTIARKHALRLRQQLPRNIIFFTRWKSGVLVDLRTIVHKRQYRLEFHPKIECAMQEPEKRRPNKPTTDTVICTCSRLYSRYGFLFLVYICFVNVILDVCVRCACIAMGAGDSQWGLTIAYFRPTHKCKMHMRWGSQSYHLFVGGKLNGISGSIWERQFTTV